ncbi:MAG: carbohydrate ABC transporter permease [Bacillota bacterium]
MNLKERFNIDLNRRKTIIGYMFISPFSIGIFLFIIYPFIQSIIFSLNELEITSSGFKLTFIGFENYEFALFEHSDFREIFVETILNTIGDIPLILIFSFIIATILNQKFKGRLIARVIFFLPVILTSRIIYNLEAQDYMSQVLDITGVADAEGMLGTGAIERFFISLRFPEQFVTYIIYAIERLPMIINSSAIPILIFLAALQSIPNSMYEAAKIEGASGWEMFWKVTFPLISSFFTVNIVYIIIDSFTRPDNAILDLVRNTAWGGAGYGVSTAMSWMYFISIFIFLGIVIKIITKYLYWDRS